jgi:hypothetical protein
MVIVGLQATLWEYGGVGRLGRGRASREGSGR